MNAPASAPPLDGARVRADFPILAQTIRGRRFVYLDSAASAQKPAAVLDAMRRFYETDYANVHRGVYAVAERATSAFEAARARLARFLGGDPGSLVWTRNATEAVNLVAQSWGRAAIRPGDEIVLTVMEHHANLVPWQLLAKEKGVVLRYAGLRDGFALDLDEMVSHIGPRTRLVAVSLMSNVLGTINPVRAIADAAHAAGALVLVDAAQAAPHFPVDAGALGADFLAVSGHKMMGPSGIGALWARPDLLAAMPPWMGGGEMIAEVRLDGSTFKAPPHRFEAGTPAIAEAVGLAAAVDYLEGLGMDRVAAHEADLAAYAIGLLERVPGLRILGPRRDRGGAVSFVLYGVHPHDLATILDGEGIAIRAGHHCAMPLHARLGVPASARASFYVYNTREDAEALVAALEKARRVFGLVSPPVPR